MDDEGPSTPSSRRGQKSTKITIVHDHRRRADGKMDATEVRCLRTSGIPRSHADQMGWPRG